MPWRTGFCGINRPGLDEYVKWLGRDFDAATVFSGQGDRKRTASWDNITGGPVGKPEKWLPDNQTTFPRGEGLQLGYAMTFPRGVTITWSNRLVPYSNQVEKDKTVFKDIAAGTYDAHWVTFGQRIRRFWEEKDRDLADLVIRLSWEFNQSNADQVFDGTNGKPDSRPWFIEAWRRYVNGVRKGADFPIKFDFPPARGSRIGDFETFYPGDDWVDICSISHHDNAPTTATEADWEKHWTGTDEKYGLKEMINFARSRNKPFALSEWSPQKSSSPLVVSPNPSLFLEKTFEVLRDHQGMIAFETYHSRNLLDSGDGVWEEARKTYKRLWGG
ncbi:MAG: hypothetical protein NTW86_05890 [Candidatus Sumerlaeota bacterium]|nr:hypothetical protein [Candidatus Sumerlaeota bacterium]